MSFMAELLRGKRIDDVFADTEIVYIMLADGTQVSIRGVVLVEPKPDRVQQAKAGQYLDSIRRT
jgi:hypothetical protein